MTLTRRDFVKGAAGILAPASARSSVVVVAPEGSGDPLSLPLYDTSKITYDGYFYVPTGSGSISGQSHTGFAYTNFGSAGIAYNPAGDGGAGSLFMAGSTLNNNQTNTVLGEIDIPTPKTSAPNRASLLQGYVLACGSVGTQQTAWSGDGNGIPITGLKVHNGRLIMTLSGTYSNSTELYAAFVRDSLNLSTGSVLGPYAVSDQSNQRSVGMGMGEDIPANFQSVFGGYTAFIGGAGQISTLPNTAWGPVVGVFDPDDLTGASGTKPGEMLSWFGGAQDAALGTFGQAGNSPYPFTDGQRVDPDIWNGMSACRGAFMVPESRTVFVLGPGANAFYDIGGAETGGNQGTYCDGSTMRQRFYLYDAVDLVAVLNDLPAVNEPELYDTYDMDFCRYNGSTYINEDCLGITFDAQNRRLFVLEKRGESSDGGTPGMPCVHQLSLAA